MTPQREKKYLTLLLGMSSWVFLCSLTMADPDLWGHTLYGIRAIEQGVLTEATDPFSYTANGDPWFNHEWATEYEYGWLWTNLGNSGLLAWKFSIIAGLVAWLTFTLWRSDSNLGARLLLVTFSTMCLGNFVVFIRPQLVTFLLFPIFLSILNTSWEKWTHAAWSLPLLTILWVNHHGGFLAGVALVGFYASMHWVKFFITKVGKENALLMSGVFGCTVLATFVNPYGYQLHEMLVTHLGTEQHVREWQAVWDVGFSWAYLTPFLILVFAFTLNRQWRWIDLLVMLVIAVQAVVHLRHIALLCLAEVIFLPAILSESIRRVFPQMCQRWGAPESARLRFGGVLSCVVFLFLLQIQSGIPLWKAGVRPWDIAVETSDSVPGMPTQAVRFLNDHEISGNILTDYGWAQFVIWQTFPESAIGFDGRYRTVYNAGLEADFLEFQTTGQTLPPQTPYLDEHPTEIVLLPVQAGAIKYLEQRADWQEIFRDSQALIFTKKSFIPAEQIHQMQTKLPDTQGRTWEIFPTASKTGTKIAK